jgi:hypothetical protein
MAFLGHSARLLITCTEPNLAIEQWEGMGFEVEFASEQEVRLTDGQIFVTLRSDQHEEMALEYAAASIQSVKDKILAGGNALEVMTPTELRFTGPGQLRYVVTPATPENIVHRTGDSNPVLGYLDALVVPVTDAHLSAVWAQSCGYFIAEASGDDISCVDVTDGIWMLSFREQALRAPFLAYTADIDDQWVEDLLSSCPSAQIRKDGNGSVILVVCQLPGNVSVMITPDDIE